MTARLAALVACICLTAAGCSSSSPPAATTPAAHGHADHGHDHGGHEHDHPESFAAGVAQLQATVAAVKDHLAVGASDAADEAVHALGHLIDDVRALAAHEQLGSEATATATQALDDLFDCFDKLDTAIHAPAGQSPTPADVHASLAERIDGAIKALQGTLAP